MSEGADKALLDALCHPENRKTVLEFERQVLEFLASTDEAFHFPLTLSGYQRLLAHRTAQHHGCQTETIADDSENHGKINATRTELCQDTGKEKLADAPVTVLAAEELADAPKSLKKKNGSDRVRTRDTEPEEGARAPTNKYKTFNERQQNYDRARQNYTPLNGEGPHSGSGRLAPRLLNGSDGGGSSDSKAQFRNRAQDLQDPEFQRFARMPAFMTRPEMGMFARPFGREAEMEAMFQQMSLNGGPEHMAYAIPNAIPGYGPVPHPYYPQGPMMQQFQQGVGMHPMGMYGNGSVPFAYQMPQQPFPQAYPQAFNQPYSYMPVRPNGVMHQYPAPQMNGGVVPIYPQYMQQGYSQGFQGGPPPAGRQGFPGQSRGPGAYQGSARPPALNGNFSGRKSNPSAQKATRSDSEPLKTSESPRTVPSATPTAAAPTAGPAPIYTPASSAAPTPPEPAAQSPPAAKDTADEKV